MYTLRAEVMVGNASVDAVETSAGFRSVHWGVDRFAVNGKVFDLRGFSHHNSIGGLGVALPERINLFRVQASRALGSANEWNVGGLRNSNGVPPVLLSTTVDALLAR